MSAHGLKAAASSPRTSAEALDFYREQSAFTSPGRHGQAFDALPNDPTALARIVQGLVLHKYMAQAYGVDVPTTREVESHTRRVENMLDQILVHDDRPLHAPRAPDRRLLGVCGQFTVMLVAMLRGKGIPARERAGFGSYFNAPYYEEHALCEYWNNDQARWVLLDTQFDEVWRTQLKIDHDPFDVPRDRFLVASDAWTLCRSGKADPGLFGIFNGNRRGLWFIAAELIRDVAALNKAEVLVWDVWGAMPEPDTQLAPDDLQTYDRLAALTRDPDTSFAELRALYRDDTRVQVPPVVFNVVTNRPESI